MKKYLYCLVLLPVLWCGCTSQTNWGITLKKEDKIPYGTYIAYQALPYYFPGARIVPLSQWFRYSNMGNGMQRNDTGVSLLIMEGLDFNASEPEWDSIKQFAANGNEVLLFCSRLGENIENRLKCYKRNNGREETGLSAYYNGKTNMDALTFGDSIGNHYGFEGRSLEGYFDTSRTVYEEAMGKRRYEESYNNDSLATVAPQVLGYGKGKPDVVRYTVGYGHITLHAAPLILTNYFLLQQQNKDYLQKLWNSFPTGVNRIYWNDMYKRTEGKSDLSVLWRYPAARWGLLLGLLALLLFVLFEGKRRQRIVPIIIPLKNESVSFVETVGRLYYNQGDHLNIAHKMMQQFLEWVRTNYYLSTSQINEQFIQQLMGKSGMPENAVREMVEMIHELRLNDIKIDEAYLYHLYNAIQSFYNNKP